MGILFISHSSRDNEQALEVRDWLRDNGWGESFLDLDPEHGIAPGQRWLDELTRAGERCSAVIALITPHWIASDICRGEGMAAVLAGKRVFGAIAAPVALETLPFYLNSHFQRVDISDSGKKAEGLTRLGIGLKRAGLDPKHFPWPPPGEPNRPVYRGLKTLEEKDAAIFFGRDAAITRGLDALRRMRAGAPERMLVILGASGAGKLSFLKAGLLARLLRDSANFLVLPTLRPERAALRGSTGLLRSFGLANVPEKPELAKHLKALREEVMDDLCRHAAAARETYGGLPPTLVLPIDQSEEFFAAGHEESAAALDLLRDSIVADGDLVVVMTIRSDSFSRLQAEKRLETIPRQPFDLPRLTPGAFKEVIEGPGQLAKPAIHMAPALAESLMTQLNTPDALPLLAFTLEHLVVDHRGSGPIEAAEFETGLGGLGGAIEKAVDAAFSAAARDPSLPTGRAALEGLAKRAFLPWLVTVDDAVAPPKRRAMAIESLPAETHRLVEHLVDQRLLQSDLRDGARVIEVAHEAVLRHWGILATWIVEERDALRTVAAVQVAAAEWKKQQMDPAGALSWLAHRGQRLIDTQKLLDPRPDYRELLAKGGSEYLAACRQADDEERAEEAARLSREKEHLDRRRQLQHKVGAFQTIAAAVLLVFALVALTQVRGASRQVSLVLTDYAGKANREDDSERALRLAILGAREGALQVAEPAAAQVLAAAAQKSSLVHELRGHPKGVAGFRESADGTTLVSWGNSGEFFVWDPASGRRIASVRHSEEQASTADVHFAAAGELVTSWGSRLVQVWEAKTGRALVTLPHPDGLNGAVLDAQGSRVLTWGNGFVKVWNVATGHQLVKYTGHPGEVVDAVFDAAGSRVLSCGDDGTARIWKAATGEEIARVRHRDEAESAVFVNGGRRVLSIGDDQDVLIWDAASGKQLAAWEPTRGEVMGSAFDPSRNRAAVWTRSDEVKVWDTASGQHFPSPQQWTTAYGMAFDESGERLLGWTGGGRIQVWEVATGARLGASSHPGWIQGAVFFEKGSKVLSWSSDGLARIWEADTGNEISSARHSGAVEGAILDAYGMRVLTWSTDGLVLLWRPDDGKQLASTRHQHGVKGAAFGKEERLFSWDAGDPGDVRIWSASPSRVLGFVRGLELAADGRRLLTFKGRDLELWDMAAGERTAVFTQRAVIAGAAFDASSSKVVAWGDELAQVWDLVTRKEVAVLEHGEVVRWSAFDSGGGKVFTASGKRAVIWNAGSGERIAALEHPSPLTGAAVDPAGRLLLTLAQDGIPRLWQLAKAAGPPALELSPGVTEARFDSRGELVLGWSAKDGAVQVWNAATGARLGSVQHPRAARGAIFDAPTGKVFSWGKDGDAWVWETASGKKIAEFRISVGQASAEFDRPGRHVLVSYPLGAPAEILDITSGQKITLPASGAESTTGIKLDPTGTRLLGWDEDTVRIWDLETGVELARLRTGTPLRAVDFAASGRIVLHGLGQDVRLWQAAWTIPRPTSHILIADVCRAKLPLPDVPAGSLEDDSRPLDYLRRISKADADFAPILRGRIGEDVCAAPSWLQIAGEKLARLLPDRW